MPILTVENVCFKYEKSDILKNISFSIDKGDYTCLIGSNGSGKSTLLKIIVGILELQSGNVSFSVPPGKVAYVEQLGAIDRTFPATVWEIVLSGTQKPNLFHLPFYTKKDREAAESVLERLKIANVRKNRIGNLSGGQQQRVMIARALVKSPECMILDEPLAALDPSITDEINDLLSGLNREGGITFLIATHDLDQVKKYATRIMEMKNDVMTELSPDEWKYNGGHKHG